MSNVMQGDLSRKEWVAPALSPLTEGAGTTGTTGTGTGFRATINNAVEGAKEYLPPQVHSLLKYLLPLMATASS